MTCDPPFLLAANDVPQVVDKVLEVVDRYHDRILRLERSVLLRPKMTTVREREPPILFPAASRRANDITHSPFVVHVLSGDLTLHRRTLAPIKSLVYGLRRYDLDRCKALVTSSNPNASTDNVRGFLSHQASVYLVSIPRQFARIEFRNRLISTSLLPLQTGGR